MFKIGFMLLNKKNECFKQIYIIKYLDQCENLICAINIATSIGSRRDTNYSLLPVVLNGRLDIEYIYDEVFSKQNLKSWLNRKSDNKFERVL